MNILERTFGLEVEFANVEKKAVPLPSGYEWSPDEVIRNTDGSKGTFSAKYGGEINTPPLLPTLRNRKILRQLYQDLMENGAKVTRELSLQTHIYVGDCTLEEIKRIFYLMYYTSMYIDEISYSPNYSKFAIFAPSPTLEEYEKVVNAKSFDMLRAVFEDSSNKGFKRHIVNISSYFRQGTIEFRPFFATDNFDIVENCILFSYRFIDYALKNTEEQFKEIDTLEKFKQRLKIRYEFPYPKAPLLFYGNPLNIQESLYAKKVYLGSPLVKILHDNTDSNLSTVNPDLYNLELRIYKSKKVTIYNNDELSHLLYLVATDQLKINYSNAVSFLQEYNSNEVVDQVACLLIFHKIRKFIGHSGNVEYSKNSMGAIELGMEKSKEKSIPMAEALIDLFAHCTYKLGTINDAINDGGCIFFQYDNFSKHRTTCALLRTNSNYTGKFDRMGTEYYDLVETLPPNVTLTIASMNKYLNLFKCAQFGEITFYSSKKPEEKKVTQQRKSLDLPVFNEPPDDLDINDKNKLNIIKVPSKVFRDAQLTYVTKVHKIASSVKFCYFVMYEGYVLGGFGFDFPKDEDYDIWLLSDFSTNNRVPRLSKLILLCIKTKLTKKYISRGMMEEVRTCYTKVYTQAPVSMKYRGLFKKASKEPNFLIYETELGEINNTAEVIQKYQSFKKKAK